MIVDAHLHVFLPVAEDPNRTVDALAPPDREARVELLDAHMRDAGVDGAVLVPLGPEDDYVASAVAADPARFRSIAVATPELTAAGPSDPASVDPGRVADRLERGGFSGMRFFGLPGTFDERPPWVAVLERLAATDRVLWLYPPEQDLPTVAEVAHRLPDLRIVLNHSGFTQAGIDVDELGRPRVHSPVPQPHEAKVLDLAASPNVSVIVSGAYGFSSDPYPYPDVAGVTRRLAERFGVDRLSWASDFPWIVDLPGYRACLELVDLHLPGLTASERAAVLGDTILRTLRWKGSDATRPPT